VVRGVILLARISGHDPAGSAVGFARRRDRVFLVIAGGLPRKNTLEIAESDVIARVRIGVNTYDGKKFEDFETGEAF
jgi:hypothetical protein